MIDIGTEVYFIDGGMLSKGLIIGAYTVCGELCYLIQNKHQPLKGEIPAYWVFENFADAEEALYKLRSP